MRLKVLAISFILFLSLTLISSNTLLALDKDNGIFSNGINYSYFELTPQVVPTGLQRIGAEGIESINDLDVDIAIMDVGVAPHRDLNLIHRYNAINPANDYPVLCKHGTHVAGIAAAKNDEGGILGVAPGARIWDIRIAECDPENGEPRQVAERSFLNGLEYVLDHSDEIDVVNISYNQECDRFCNAESEQEIINDIVASGILVIASAGNNHEIAEMFVPPRLENVISVSAISDSDGKCGGLGQPTSQGVDDILAIKSNWGDGIDIAAPGIDILSTLPNDMYGTMSGTSMAAPYVSGTAALIIASDPNIEPDTALRRILDASSTPITQCDGNSRGYFNDLDDLHEPLLYIKDLISN